MPKEDNDERPNKKMRIDKAAAVISSDLSALSSSSHSSNFNPSEAEGVDDELISQYKKEKPKVNEVIQSSGLLPTISEEDLTKGAKEEEKKVKKDLDKALSGNAAFYQKFAKSESFVNIISQLKETVKFYKFSIAPKKEREQLMQSSNAELSPKNTLLDDSSEESKRAETKLEIAAKKQEAVNSDISESQASTDDRKWAARPDIDPNQRGEGSSKTRE